MEERLEHTIRGDTRTRTRTVTHTHTHTHTHTRTAGVRAAYIFCRRQHRAAVAEPRMGPQVRVRLSWGVLIVGSGNVPAP